MKPTQRHPLALVVHLDQHMELADATNENAMINGTVVGETQLRQKSLTYFNV